ncbi:hypothetical protein SDC9_172703 [bioreactor metagenome]|uniref:Uncharacterized protein n=1 Tax=bioreactor metagenome TaxID=1076179 RepID=A0A645GGJ7_9ZZZZ
MKVGEDFAVRRDYHAGSSDDVGVVGAAFGVGRDGMDVDHAGEHLGVGRLHHLLKFARIGRDVGCTPYGQCGGRHRDQKLEPHRSSP